MTSHTHSSDEYEYLILPILLLLSIFFTFLLLHFLLRRGTHRRLPPGRQGFPLVGETLQLIWAYKTENPEPFIDERVGRFGSVFTTHVFGEGTIFSADPEVNRLILQSEGKFVDVSYPGSISNLLGKHSLLLMKGSLHKRMHSLTINFSSSPPMLKDHLLFDIDRLVRSNLDSWSDHVLLMEQAKKITFELAMKQLLSLDPCEWTERLRREYVLVIEGFFTLPFPLFSTTYRRAIQARAKVAEALRLVVRERRKVVEAEESSVDEKWTTKKKKNDILGALLGAADEDLSEDEIVDFLVGMLVAGYETTSTSMTLAVKFLTDNPAALAHLREEHDDIRRRKGEAAEALDWTDYKSSMPFTQCVVNETLRVGNIISGVFRRAITDIPLKGGYTIPKGWKVFASFRAVHMDPIHFKDARTFNPWRWHHRHQDNNSAGRGNVFTPFGGGGRLCPGYELARLQLSVFLHHLVTRFSWEPAEKDKLVFFPTTRTQKQYPINVTRRNQV